MLNLDLTLKLLDYWSPADLAILAQLNKGWKCLIYRDKVWNRFNWSAHTQERIFQIQAGSHHYGDKNPMCFWSWFTYHYTGYTDGYILSYEQEWVKWTSLGKPCRHLTHHEPSTCLIYPSLDSSKNYYIKSLITRGSAGDTRFKEANAYTRYLNNQWLRRIQPGFKKYLLADVEKCRAKITNYKAKAPENGTADAFRLRCSEIDLQRYQQYISEFDKLGSQIKKSCLVQQKIIPAIFGQNERIIMNPNHPIWQSIISPNIRI